MKCRFCSNELKNVFIDLVNSPVSNTYLSETQLSEPETFYPLKVFVCEKCWLVQIDEYKKSAEIFDKEYAYFSSYSTSWLKHCEDYVNMITARLGLGCTSQVLEIASNDGYLLQYFMKLSISCTGIEPTSSTANTAKEKGINTIISFFSEKFAIEHAATVRKYDLVIGNNVLAHVPDINDFVKGLKVVLSDRGTITMEFPHLLNLIKYSQFDTIYHEHYSYLSLITVRGIFNKFNMEIYDVDEVPTHGGSLRIYAKHIDNKMLAVTEKVDKLIEKEKSFGISSLDLYVGFKNSVNAIKLNTLIFLLEEKKKGKKIAAYGAAAKGNTFLNYCGIKNDIIDFCVDKAPSKQNKYLPGSHIPIVSEDEIEKNKPDYIMIFPWNLREEIIRQLSYVKTWGAKFIVAIPILETVSDYTEVITSITTISMLLNQFISI